MGNRDPHQSLYPPFVGQRQCRYLHRQSPSLASTSPVPNSSWPFHSAAEPVPWKPLSCGSPSPSPWEWGCSSRCTRGGAKPLPSPITCLGNAGKGHTSLSSFHVHLCGVKVGTPARKKAPIPRPVKGCVCEWWGRKLGHPVFGAWLELRASQRPTQPPWIPRF